MNLCHAHLHTVNSRYLEVVRTIFCKFKLPEVQINNLDLLKSLKSQIMVGESNQNVFLIQMDESKFAEFEISEFETSRFDCIHTVYSTKLVQ